MLVSSPPWQYFVKKTEQQKPKPKTKPTKLQIWDLNIVAKSFEKHLKCLLYAVKNLNIYR